jgi:hypothetical protein
MWTASFAGTVHVGRIESHEHSAEEQDPALRGVE